MEANNTHRKKDLIEEIEQLELVLAQKKGTLAELNNEERLSSENSLVTVTSNILIQEDIINNTLKHTSLLVVTINREGTILSFNESFTNALLYSVDHISNANIFQLSSDLYTDSFFSDIKDGEPIDCTLLTKNQSEISVRFNPILFQDANGNISNIILIGEDISEQVYITQALYETNALLQDIFDNSHDVIFIFDQEGDILFVNNTFQQLLGYSNQELEESTMFDFVSPELKGKTKDILDKAKQRGVLNNFDTILIKKNSKKIKLSGALSCKIEEGGRCIYRATFFDITEQDKVKKEQELYYGIAKLVEKGIPLNDLYHKFYLYLNEAIKVDSFLIVIQHNGEQISTPFYVNSSLGPEKEIQGLSFAKDALVLDRPMFLYEEVIDTIITQRKLTIHEEVPKVWIGVPLSLNNQSQGVIVVQSYRSRTDCSKKDLELLSFVSGHLASAIIRNKNENQIKEQKARLEAIFESGSHLMWSIERFGKLNKYNQNFSQKFADYLKVKPNYKMNLLSKLKANSKSETHTWVKRYISAFKGIIQQFEVKFISNTGEENWWDISLNPIKNNLGETVEVSGVAHDITQKKITEIGLAESEEKFRNIFDSLLDVYFRVNMEGIITMVSPSVFELIGKSQLEIVGKHISEFYLNKQKLKYLILNLLKDGYVKNFESRIFEKNNRPHNIISNFRLLYDNVGNPSHIEGVARDITELKNKTEELRAAKNLAEKSLEVKKRFLSNMSHEIRTPMNGIIGMIDLMSTSTLNTEQKQYVSTIKKSSETLLNILNDILDLSKIEAGKMELRPLPSAMPNVLDKLFALFHQNASSKNTELILNINENVPKGIFADETRLLQILSNLLSNAIKFTENGTVTVNCSKEEQIDNKVKLLFEVEDTGIGISKDHLDDLFKTFSQVDTSYTKSYGGTGLGLAISEELCNMMGGEIGVRSEINVGSTFWFTVILEECDYALIQKRFETVEEQNIYFDNSPKVLIVDDNEVNRVVASTILGKVGCQVTIASSAFKALDILKTTTFDIVFMDIQMPEMNGITATKEIHKLNLPHVPTIIAMTAFSMKEEREEFLEAGMDDYVAKPIKAKILIAKVKEWIVKSNTPIQTENKESISTEKVKLNALPIIDLKIPEELYEYGGKDLIELSYSEFDKNGSELVEKIKAESQKENTKEIAEVLHTLKGDAGTLGIKKVYELAKKMEFEVKNGQKITLDLDNLDQSFLEFRENYKQILNL